MSLLELLNYGFVQRALAAAVLLGIGCGVLSFFVVQRKLALMGHGVAHSMVAGVGLAVLLEWPVFWPALAVAVAVSLGIGWIAKHQNVTEDSAIGITLSAALAIGLVIISLKKGYVSDLESYLFGSLLAVTVGDLYQLAGVAIIVLLPALLAWKPLLMYAFDPESTAVAGYPVGLLRNGVLVMLAVIVAVSMKIVGILLVGAFLVIPAAAAGCWSFRAVTVVYLSVAIAVISAAAGMIFSLTVNVPAGAAIVLTLFIVFLIGRLFGCCRN